MGITTQAEEQEQQYADRAVHLNAMEDEGISDEHTEYHPMSAVEKRVHFGARWGGSGVRIASEEYSDASEDFAEIAGHRHQATPMEDIDVDEEEYRASRASSAEEDNSAAEHDVALNGFEDSEPRDDDRQEEDSRYDTNVEVEEYRSDPEEEHYLARPTAAYMDAAPESAPSRSSAHVLRIRRGEEDVSVGVASKLSAAAQSMREARGQWRAEEMTISDDSPEAGTTSPRRANTLSITALPSGAGHRAAASDDASDYTVSVAGFAPAPVQYEAEDSDVYQESEEGSDLYKESEPALAARTLSVAARLTSSNMRLAAPDLKAATVSVAAFASAADKHAATGSAALEEEPAPALKARPASLAARPTATGKQATRIDAAAAEEAAPALKARTASVAALPSAADRYATDSSNASEDEEILASEEAQITSVAADTAAADGSLPGAHADMHKEVNDVLIRARKVAQVLTAMVAKHPELSPGAAGTEHVGPARTLAAVDHSRKNKGGFKLPSVAKAAKAALARASKQQPTLRVSTASSGNNPLGVIHSHGGHRKAKHSKWEQYEEYDRPSTPALLIAGAREGAVDGPVLVTAASVPLSYRPPRAALQETDAAPAAGPVVRHAPAAAWMDGTPAVAAAGAVSGFTSGFTGPSQAPHKARAAAASLAPAAVVAVARRDEAEEEAEEEEEEAPMLVAPAPKPFAAPKAAPALAPKPMLAPKPAPNTKQQPPVHKVVKPGSALMRQQVRTQADWDSVNTVELVMTPPSVGDSQVLQLPADLVLVKADGSAVSEGTIAAFKYVWQLLQGRLLLGDPSTLAAFQPNWSGGWLVDGPQSAAVRSS